MADVKNAPVKNAPVKNDAPKPVTPPVTPPVTEEKKKEKRPVQQVQWPTADAAKAEAAKRTYGPRKAYTVKIGNTTVHCVAYNDQYAAYEAFVAAGGTIEELGGTTRATKVTDDAVISRVSSMSPEAIAKLKAELAKLG